MVHERFSVKIAPWAILTFLAAMQMGCSRATQTDLPPIVAMVNGEAITLGEFDRALAALTAGAPSGAQDEDPHQFWDEAMDQLIEKKVLLQEARSRGVGVTDMEVQVAIEQMKGDYTDESFNGLLRDEGLGFDQWKAELTEKLVIDKFINSLAADVTDISEKQIKAYYEEHRKEFAKKTEVKARQIAVATEVEAKAVREKLLNGADFAALARDTSISPDGESGGDLGFFSEGQMPEEFAIMFKLKINEISPIVKSPYGYHIFRVEAKRRPRTQPLEEVRDSIRHILFGEQEEEVRARRIEDLKSKANIQINTTLLLQQARIGGQKDSKSVQSP